MKTFEKYLTEKKFLNQKEENLVAKIREKYNIDQYTVDVEKMILKSRKGKFNILTGQKL